MPTPNPTPFENTDDELLQVAIWVCRPCLDNEPGECHTAGCIQWLRSDIPDEMGERLDFTHKYEAINDTHHALQMVKAELRDVETEMSRAEVQGRAKWYVQDRIAAINKQLTGDNGCPYTQSHTKEWCGREGC